MAKLIKDGIVYNSAPSSARLLPYDNTDSGLSATNVKDAIDELAENPAPSTLGDLTDVDITSPSNGQILKYSNGDWVNAAESGGSTVSVTQIQSTGTKIATVTVDNVDTDLYAPTGGGSSSLAGLSDVSLSSPTSGQVLQYDGTDWINANAGGGSGGHTILNDSGTSLAQQPNLQFKGAYSKNDSINSKTEVNVIRSMTKAEFDLLSDAEKVGIIDVIDVTSNSENEFQPVIYSTDEREIGVWTDGKPLYQKSFSYNVSSSTTYSINVTSCNIDVFVSYELSGAGNTYYYGGGDYIRAYIADVNPVTTLIVTGGSSYPKAIGYITIRYTKTTDTAGSGQWTPQGVPAVHYSTDEHIIGTWVDESTLYEKTWNVTAPSSTTSTRVVDLSGMNINKIIFQDAFISVSDNITPHGGGSFVIWYRTPNNATTPNNCIMCTVSNSTYCSGDMSVTLRYTKSSS